MTLLHALLCSLAAFSALCLAIERHHEEALGEALVVARQRALRGLALGALAFSTLMLWQRPDHGIAAAEWVAQLSLAGLAVVALATWAPRWLAPVAAAAGVAGLLLALIA